jgi:ribosomal-protein-alanine N-acetyltransferase
MTEILTPRLRLRRATIDDLNDLHGLLGNPTAMRYWSTPPHDSLEHTRTWLDQMIASPPDSSDDFIVEHRGRVIGKAGCWRLPEIGFIFHPDYWGQGLASEALTAVIERVFDTFPIPAIRADVDPRNAASLRLLSRLGFREVDRVQRTWKIGDVWCDSVYLELQRPGGPTGPLV